MALIRLLYRRSRSIPYILPGISLPSLEIQRALATKSEGYEVRAVGPKGEGVFATRSFMRKELVMQGVISAKGIKNNVHAAQVGENEYLLHADEHCKLNHSCDPNCGIQLNPTGAHDYIAFRDIADGEELTFDYAMQNYSVQHFPADCKCGAEKCRGRIEGWKALPEETKRDYKGFIAPYLLELDTRAAN